MNVISMTEREDNEIHDAVKRVAGSFVMRDGFTPKFDLKQGGKNGRLFTLDMNPFDVQPKRISGPGIIGSIDGMKRAADFAAPVRRVRAQDGYLQDMVLTSDISKIVRPLGSAAGAQPARVNPSVANVAYTCKEYAIDVSVPVEVIKNADQDLATALGMYARDTWALAREYKVAQVMTTPGNWGLNTVAGSTWSSSGNPILDLFKALQLAKNPRPDTVIMSEVVGQYWYSNATVQAFYMTGALQELGLKVVTVGAKMTSAGSLLDIWASVGRHVVLCRAGDAVDADSGVVDLSTAASARWDRDGSNIDGVRVPKDEVWLRADGVLMRMFWDPRNGARGMKNCVIVANEDVVMVDKTLGALITTVA